VPSEEAPQQEPSREVLIWDDFVHETQELARLYFWRLSFSPSYDHDTIFEKLRGVYSTLGITSYIAYETLGDYDLLLRMWVPRNIGPEEIDQQIWLALKDCKLWNINYLACRTEMHWSDSTKPKVEAEGWPDPYDSIIRDVNEFNRMQVVTQEAQSRTPGITDLVERGVLIPIPTDTRGIRFFITFDHPRSAFNRGQRKRALSSIVTKCNEVGDAWCAKKLKVGNPQISVYEGAGTMSEFLVMARAPHGRFHEFVHDLTDGLRSAGLDELFDMRPYTHVMADEMFSEFAEQRPVIENTDFDFAVDEDESVEFKATFALNFRSYMAVDRQDEDEKMIAIVVRTVCGLLNSPGGGVLVIGILEVRRELERLKTDKLEYLRKLQERFGYVGSFAGEDAVIPADLPNAVIGIAAEVGVDRLFPDSDKYVGRLTEALRTGIKPNPWPWLTVAFPQADGKTVCMVKARPADVWFYAKSPEGKHEEFHVREATSTRLLVGIESDDYKSAHPRNGHGKI
jgi:hypothetical protein